MATETMIKMRIATQLYVEKCVLFSDDLLVFLDIALGEQFEFSSANH